MPSQCLIKVPHGLNGELTDYSYPGNPDFSEDRAGHRVTKQLCFIKGLLLLGHSHSSAAATGGLGVLTAHTQTGGEKRRE